MEGNNKDQNLNNRFPDEGSLDRQEHIEQTGDESTYWETQQPVPQSFQEHLNQQQGLHQQPDNQHNDQQTMKQQPYEVQTLNHSQDSQQNNNTQNNQQPYDEQQYNQQNQYDQQNLYNQQHQYNQLPYSQQQPFSQQQQYNKEQYSQQHQYNQQPYNQQPYSQQSQYNQQPYSQRIYSSGNNQFSNNNKTKRILVAVIVTLFLLGLGAATAYAYKDVILNSYAKATKSPVEYYAYIEKKSLSEGIDGLTSALDFKALDSGDTVAYDLKSEVTVNKESLDSLLQTSLGVSYTELESNLGLSLDSMSFDALVATDGSLLNETLELSLNNVKIISANVFFDKAANELLVRYPELSEAYINMLGSSNNADASVSEVITKELTADLLKRYSNIIIENIHQVEMTGTTSLSLGSLTTDCTLLTASITEEDWKQIALKILQEARTDVSLLNVLSSFDITREDFQSSIDQAITNIQASTGNSTDTILQMSVYVDNKGHILGRELRYPNNKSAFGYTVLSEKDHHEYKIYDLDYDGSTIFEIEGNQTKQEDAYSGVATLILRGADQYSSDFSINLTYQDMRTEIRDNSTYQYGSVTLSSLELMGLQVLVDFDVEGDIQTNKVVFQLGAEPLITVNSRRIPMKEYKLANLPEGEEVYTLDQIESYLATIDFDSYISDLSNRLGVDLEGILNSLQSVSIY